MRKAFTAMCRNLMLCIFLFASLLTIAQQTQSNEAFNKMLNAYYEEELHLNPLGATQRGDNRYNDILLNDISVPYLNQLSSFYKKYRKQLGNYKREQLNSFDRISYDMLSFQIKMAQEKEKFHLEYFPFDQLNSLPARLPVYGSGSGIQPFKTVKDYDNWLKRIDGFVDWADTAIANFNKGINASMVLPQALVVKMISQMEALQEPDTAKSIFYGPIKKMPSIFAEEEKASIRVAYQNALSKKIIPTYSKLALYLKNTYLPKARTSSGFNALNNGAAIYQYFVSFYTTTNKTPNQVYETGLQEVARIAKEIETVKSKIGFKGSMDSLDSFMKSDKQFLPFTTEEQVLDSFRAILPVMEPNIKRLFNIVPKSKFEVRAIEKFRAASTPSNYVRGTEDGSRPGVFYAKIMDATSFNALGMQSLFSHEAIPGHHFQLSLQMENTNSSKLRKFTAYPVFSEGWALYVESLGEELGLCKNPYEKIASLRSEIFRAARLVIDVAIHTGKMNRLLTI